MFKRIMLMISLLSVVLLTFANSFTFAFDINDYIEVEQGDMPTEANSDVQLFDNSEDNNVDSSDLLDINEDYYDEDHLAEGEEENVESFDTKVEYFTLDDDSEDDSTTQTSDDSDSDVSFDLSSSDYEAETASDDSGIMLLSDDDYEEDENISSHSVYDADNYKWDFDTAWPSHLDPEGTTYFSVPIYSSSECLAIFNNGINAELNGNYTGYDDDYNAILDDSENIINSNDLIIFKFVNSYGVAWYNFVFTNADFYLSLESYTSTSYTVDSDCYCGIFNFCYFLGKSSSSVYGDSTISSGTFRYIGDITYNLPYTDHNSSANYLFPVDASYSVIYSGGHSLYVNGEKADVLDEEGFISGDISGSFSLNEKSDVLTYKAWSTSDLSSTYDVHLWAFDNSDVPTAITGSEDFPIVDLDNYTNNNLQLSPDVSTCQASVDLESIYYYVHQLSGYDDSLESVDGYDFEAFESRENLYFVIAYRASGSSDRWVVCSSYQYNYGDLINNTMGAFTAKKEYLDFPDIDDYIEEFPDFDDYLYAIDDDPGIIDYVVAGFEWIGACIKVLGHNFIGFFKWIFDCIPILWQNLTIALYNLVCDLKSLFLYLFNPKVNSILQMAEERIPGLTSFITAAKNGNTATLPSFTIFGAKFSLDLSDYDLPWNYLKSFSQVIIMILFAVGTYNLIAHVFGFVKIDNVDDTFDDE